MALTLHERRVLAEIEHELSARDPELAARMKWMRAAPPGDGEQAQPLARHGFSGGFTKSKAWTWTKRVLPAVVLLVVLGSVILMSSAGSAQSCTTNTTGGQSSAVNNTTSGAGRHASHGFSPGAARSGDSGGSSGAAGGARGIGPESRAPGGQSGGQAGQQQARFGPSTCR